VNHIIISTYSTPTLVQKYINKKLKSLYLKSYRPISYTHMQDDIAFITYLFPENLPKMSYVTLIAKGIADYIQEEFASQYAADIIRNHDSFLVIENNKVIQMPCILEEDDKTDELINTIKEEILEKNNFCIDGWIKFRLVDYKLYIRRKVERIIFEYLAHKEYEEFIGLLKEFIKTQQSSIKILHIMPKANGSIGLYDRRYAEIPTMCLEEYGIQVQEDTSDKEDIVLSTLLTMSPLKIKIHQKEFCQNQRLIQTIQMVYEGKVSLCKNCKHCEFIGDILTQKRL